MARTVITAARPAHLEPHEVELVGYYQSDPGTDPARSESDPGWWEREDWREVIRFRPNAPWSEVNKIIANVGIGSSGNIIIAAGIDLSAFLLSCAVVDDKQRLAAVLSDPHRVLTRQQVAELAVFLVEQYAGGKAETR